jgi:hypothetical protein
MKQDQQLRYWNMIDITELVKACHYKLKNNDTKRRYSGTGMKCDFFLSPRETEQKEREHVRKNTPFIGHGLLLLDTARKESFFQEGFIYSIFQFFYLYFFTPHLQSYPQHPYTAV